MRVLNFRAAHLCNAVLKFGCDIDSRILQKGKKIRIMLRSKNKDQFSYRGWSIRWRGQLDSFHGQPLTDQSPELNWIRDEARIELVVGLVLLLQLLMLLQPKLLKLKLQSEDVGITVSRTWSKLDHIWADIHWIVVARFDSGLFFHSSARNTWASGRSCWPNGPARKPRTLNPPVRDRRKLWRTVCCFSETRARLKHARSDAGSASDGRGGHWRRIALSRVAGVSRRNRFLDMVLLWLNDRLVFVVSSTLSRSPLLLMTTQFTLRTLITVTRWAGQLLKQNVNL